MPKAVYYIPNGPKNLQALFPYGPDFRDIAEYFVEVRDGSDTVIATTNLSQVILPQPDYIRVHFVNRLGCIDAIDFVLSDIQQERKSETTEKPKGYPLVKSEHGVKSFNVKSNDTYTVLNYDYNENDIDFIDELFASPAAWMEWKGTQGQPDDYLPIVINDQKCQKRKLQDRFTYEVSLEFKLSHEKTISRN